jgi:hypothetical protein
LAAATIGVRTFYNEHVVYWRETARVFKSTTALPFPRMEKFFGLSKHTPEAYVTDYNSSIAANIGKDNHR